MSDHPNAPPRLASLSVTLEQDNDSCDGGDLGQYLEVSTQDGGAGAFLVLRTERWAVDADEIDALAARLKAILAMVEEPTP